MPYLTPRELQLMELVSRGLTSVAIGRKLGITTGTVDNELYILRKKLDVTSRVDLAVIWIQETFAERAALALEKSGRAIMNSQEQASVAAQWLRGFAKLPAREEIPDATAHSDDQR